MVPPATPAAFSLFGVGDDLYITDAKASTISRVRIRPARSLHLPVCHRIRRPGYGDLVAIRARHSRVEQCAERLLRRGRQPERQDL